MVDLAEQAFSTKNYDLAAEIYERNIREGGPSVALYLGLANSYARGGRLQEAFRAYSNAFKCGTVTPEHLTNLVAALVDKMDENEDLNSRRKASEEDQMFACDICKGIWNDPVTVSCGHTFCRNCLEKTASQTCKKCSVVYNGSKFSQFKTNILLSNIVNKWFSDVVKAVKLKAEGNAFVSKGKYEEALKVYTEAISLAPTDHLLSSNRSFAFASLDRFSEALQDADITIKLRPDWAKGYYRKGMALSGLGFHESAALAYLQCLMLDPSVTSARRALAKALHSLLRQLPEDVKVAELQSVLAAPMARPFGTQHFPSDYSASALSLLQSGISEELLQQIKHRLRETLLQSRLLPAARAPSPEPEVLNKKPCGMEYLVQEDSRCQSAPASPKVQHRRHISALLASQSEPSLSRKRSSFDSCLDQDGESSGANDCQSETPCKQRKYVPPELLNKDDFDCSLCYRLLFNPVTTPCGHTYCRHCLDRSMDHCASCPLCKSSLAEYLAERRQVTTESVDSIIQTYFPIQYHERKKIHEEELTVLTRMDTDQFEVPIFVCTMAFPTVPCPLHIFEPRYRLMIRQCMESGTRQFGMCICLGNNDDEFAGCGTLLEIRDAQYFPDGRSVVDTVGGRRFKVISRGHRDGYNTAMVEIIRDKPVPEGLEFNELQKLHTEVHQEARDWLNSLPTGHKQRIRQHFGDFPELEPNHLRQENGPAWLWWLTAIMPLDSQAQLTILAMGSLRDRLLSVRRVLSYVHRQHSH